MILMLLWPISAGWRVVFGWLRTAQQRMAAHAKRNEELPKEQRAMLREESASVKASADRVRVLGRAVEDAEDDVVREARNEAFVTDAMCDLAQGETWGILGIRKAILSQAGTTRDAVLGASLRAIKNASRARTVEYAGGTARELRNLPSFPERDALAEKLDRRANAHEEASGAVEDANDAIEKEHRSPLGALLAKLRVDVVGLHGRLVDKLGREIAESLFPRTEREGAEEPPPAAPPLS